MTTPPLIVVTTFSRSNGLLVRVAVHAHDVRKLAGFERARFLLFSIIGAAPFVTETVLPSRTTIEPR